jgi:epoxyqueuosine reductase QueG
MQNEIMNILPNQEDYVIGFADMADLVKEHYPYRYAVVIGKRRDDTIIDEIENGPTLVYYELYRSTNDELNLITARISRFLEQNGIACMQIKSTVQEGDITDEFRKTLRVNFSHKMAASRAGLGWIGKTDLLVSERFGPRIRLASVLTHHKFDKLGIPITESQCGDCDLCVTACPGQAANGKLWDDTMDRDAFYDAFKCRDACRKLSQERLDKNVHVCGICVSVCPYGRRAEK